MWVAELSPKETFEPLAGRAVPPSPDHVLRLLGWEDVGLGLGSQEKPMKVGDYPPSFLCTALLDPVRLETLRPECKRYIGRRLQFRYVGTGYEGDPYPGQWRWLPTELNLGWLPHEDLRDIEWAQ